MVIGTAPNDADPAPGLVVGGEDAPPVQEPLRGGEGQHAELEEPRSVCQGPARRPSGGGQAVLSIARLPAGHPEAVAPPRSQPALRKIWRTSSRARRVSVGVP